MPIDPQMSASLIQGAGSLTGQLAQNVAMNRNLRLQNKYNKQLADYTYNKDLEMWNRQNAYNNPQAQMDRLKAAGLNPNMVYGTGTVTGNTSSGSMVHYNTPEKSANVQPMIPENMPNVISMYTDLKLKQAQIDNVKAQTEATNKSTDLKAFEILMQKTYRPQNEVNKATNLYLKNFVTDLQGTLLKHQAQMAETRADQFEKELSINRNLKQRSTDILDQKIIFEKFRNQFAKMGVTTSDNILVRLMAKAIQNMSGNNAPKDLAKWPSWEEVVRNQNK